MSIAVDLRTPALPDFTEPADVQHLNQVLLGPPTAELDHVAALI